MKLDKGRERERGDMRPLIALLAPESESDQRPHRRVGKLSATRREDGSWSIDSAELARYLDANGYRFRSKAGNADRQLLEKLRLVHREPRFDTRSRRARSPVSNT